MAGMYGNMIGGIGQIAQGFRADNAARRANEKGQQAFRAGNWNPAFASDNVPTYQRSQSPVARSFLESLVMGTNPAMVRSTAPNAGLQKQQMQQQENQMFGTPQERMELQQRIFRDQPWAVEAPDTAMIDEVAPDEKPKSKKDRRRERLRKATDFFKTPLDFIQHGGK